MSAFVAVFVLVLGFALASSAIAEDESSDATPAVEATDIGDGLTPAVEADVRAQLREQQEEQDRLAELADRADKDDLGPNASKALLEDLFGAQLDIVPDPLGAVDVLRFVSDNAAVVKPDDQAKPILLESTTPLRVDTGSGKEPLDLTLAREGADFAPDASSTDVELSRDLDQGLEVGGVELSFPDADGAALGSLTSERSAAFYSEISEDTDLVVAPTPNGIETFTQLRTPESPTSQRVDLGIPAGAVVAAKDGGALVTHGEKTLLSISAPTAIDAAGEPVPVELSIDGDSVVIEATPGPDATYPILVDPIYEQYNWWFGNTTAGLTDWTPFSTPVDAGWNPYVAPFAGVFMGQPPALWVFANPGFYRAGSGTNWNYYVPRYASDQTTYGSRPTSYVASTNMVMVGGNNGDTSTTMFMQGSVGDPITPALINMGGYPTDGTPASYSYSNTSNNQLVKQASFGLTPLFAAAWISQIRFADLRYADVGLGDTAAPTLNSVTVPTPWSSTTPAPISMNGTDTGLGVQKFSLQRINVPGTAPINYFSSCAGTVSSPCPRQKTTIASSSYDYTSLAEGTHTFEVKAYDPVLNTSAAKNVTVKIDRTAPDLNATGTLVNTSNPLIGAYPKVDIDADDARSGVEKVVLKVDSTTVDQVTQTCPGGACSIEDEVQFDLSGVSSGSHTFQLVAVDFAGNTDSISGTMVLDSVAPTISGTGDLIDYDGQPLPTSSASASLSGSDSGSGNTGIAKFETTVNDGTPIVDNKTCAPNCPASATSSYTYNKSAWPTGSNLVIFTAVDKAGNRKELSIWVDVPAEQPVDLMCDATTPTVLASGDELSNEDAVDALEVDFSEAVDPSSSLYKESADQTWAPTLAPAATGATPPDVDMEMVDSFAEGEAGVLPASGFTIGHQTCMTPAQTTADETEGEIVNGDSVLYANSATDTDTVVRPTPLGAVVLQHLRGDDAPTSFTWDVSLEPGQELVELATGGIAVVITDSESYVDPSEVLVEPDRDEISDLSDTQTQYEGSYWDIEKAQQETGKEVVSVLSPPIARNAANAWVAAELEKIAQAKIALELASQPSPGEDIVVGYATATALRVTNGSGGISPPNYETNNWQVGPNPLPCLPGRGCLWQAVHRGGPRYMIAEKNKWFRTDLPGNQKVRSLSNSTDKHSMWVSKTKSLSGNPGYCVKAGKAENDLPGTKPNLANAPINWVRLNLNTPNTC